MILSRNPASLQTPRESLFSSDSEPPHSRHHVSSPPPPLPILIDAVFPSLLVPARGSFNLQESRKRLSPHSTGLWLQAFPLHPPVPASTRSTKPQKWSLIFLEDSEPTSSISHAMEDEHDSTNMPSPASSLSILQIFAKLFPFLAFPLDKHMHLLRELPGFFRPSNSLNFPRIPSLDTSWVLLFVCPFGSSPCQPELLICHLTVPPPASDPDSAFPAPRNLSVMYSTSPN